MEKIFSKPKRKPKDVHVYLEPEDVFRLKLLALHQKKTQMTIMREALSDYRKKHQHSIGEAHPEDDVEFRKALAGIWKS